MEFFSKVLVAMFFAMVALVLYRALLSACCSRGFLSLKRESRIDPERVLAVAVAFGAASIYGATGVQALLRSTVML